MQKHAKVHGSQGLTDKDVADRFQQLCDLRPDDYDFSQTVLARQGLLSPHADPEGRIVILCHLMCLTSLRRNRPSRYAEVIEEMAASRNFPCQAKSVGGRSLRSSMQLLLTLIEAGLAEENLKMLHGDLGTETAEMGKP